MIPRRSCASNERLRKQINRMNRIECHRIEFHRIEWNYMGIFYFYSYCASLFLFSTVFHISLRVVKFLYQCRFQPVPFSVGCNVPLIYQTKFFFILLVVAQIASKPLLFKAKRKAILLWLQCSNYQRPSSFHSSRGSAKSKQSLRSVCYLKRKRKAILCGCCNVPLIRDQQVLFILLVVAKIKSFQSLY